jgi:hypothetical protein
MDARAQALVGFFAQDGMTLDFSLASLKLVDDLLREARQWTDRQKEMAVVQCGAYLGEVLRRRSPVMLTWIEPPAEFRDALNVACLSSPKGLVLNPLVKPLKFLLATTDEDSLAFFARAAQDLLSREATAIG